MRLRAVVPLQGILGSGYVVPAEVLREAVQQVKGPLYLTEGFNLAKPPVGIVTELEVTDEGLAVGCTLHSGEALGVKDGQAVKRRDLGIGVSMQVISYKAAPVPEVEQARLRQLGIYAGEPTVEMEIGP